MKSGNKSIVSERRIFAPGAIIGVILLDVSLAVLPACGADNLARNFARPPHEAKPWVYWWFQGGYGNPDGMARDVAAMKEKGIGGVMHMQTVNNGGIPVPTVKMLSPEWRDWFGPMLRLGNDAGLTLSASILDGWSHGGWWVGLRDGAKRLVYSETQVEGPGPLTEPLPQPFTLARVYEDIAVVAFRERTQHPPVPLSVKADSVLCCYCNEEKWPAIYAVDHDPETYWRTSWDMPSATKSVNLNLSYPSPLKAVAAYVAGRPQAGPAEAELQWSGDGKTFSTVVRFTMEPGERKRVTFDPVTAKHFRLQIIRGHERTLQLAEFQLLREGDEPHVRPGNKWWQYKSANWGWFGWAPNDFENPYEAMEDEYPEDGAMDVASGNVLDISKHLKPDGRLDWRAPEGRWTIMRFGWTPLGEPARQGSGGYEVDVLSARRADLMMDKAAVPMRELADQCADGARLYFHTDSWEIGAGCQGQQPTWTEDFAEQFKTLRGYDLVPYLPVLARRIVGDRLTSNRFLRDYRDTVADLLAAYYGRLQERAHAMNAGINSESGYGSYPHPQLEGLRVFGRSDRPMAEVWHPGHYRAQYMQHVDIMRTAASAARIYGNRFVQAETLTFSPIHGILVAPTTYRATLHKAWACGLNQAVIHKYTHQPFEEKPGMLDYDILNRHMTWWPFAEGFIGYMGRCQYLLQQGNFAADVAYFIGEGAMRYVPGKRFLNPALPESYDYDGINAEVLETRAKVQGNRLVLPGGPSYRYMVLCDPQCMTMRSATMSRIRHLVEDGLTLVGKRPLRTPGLGNLLENEAKLKIDADVLWGIEPTQAGDRKVGKGRVVWGRSMKDIMVGDGVVPDCEATVAGKPFEPAWLHRRTESEEIYFLANPEKKQVDAVVTLRAVGGRVELFDPLDGSVLELPEYRQTEDGRIEIPLRFESEQAYFVVVRKSVVSGEGQVASRKNFPELKAVMEIIGPWEVAFDSAWVRPLPDGIAKNEPKVKIRFDQLEDWTKRREEGIRNYSGIATYRKVFDLPSEIMNMKPEMHIDLGVLHVMARVRLNGRDLGVVWCQPWRVKIPAGLLKKQGNELVVEVANTWNNRICADHALPEDERLTRVRRDVAKEGLIPSGLIGTVSLVRGE